MQDWNTEISNGEKAKKNDLSVEMSKRIFPTQNKKKRQASYKKNGKHE